MSELVDGLIGLWDGWQLVLPNECMTGRNLDGSWSAWDAAHAVEVHIVTVSGGRPIDAVTMLGATPTLHGSGWVGTVEERADADGQGASHQLAIAAAAPNTLLSCWIQYGDPAEKPWAEQLLGGLAFIPP